MLEGVPDKTDCVGTSILVLLAIRSIIQKSDMSFWGLLAFWCCVIIGAICGNPGLFDRHGGALRSITHPSERLEWFPVIDMQHKPGSPIRMLRLLRRFSTQLA